MALPELSLPPWMNAGEPAGAPFARGAQAGQAIASSFLRAREMRQQREQFQQTLELSRKEKEALITGQALRNKAVEQDMQLTAIKIADAMKVKNDAVAAEGALSTFGERIRRAKILGPNEPSAQRGVIEWAEQYRGLLTMPAGKALWEDYLNSVEEDRKNDARLEELRTGGDIRLDAAVAIAQARGTQAFDIEEYRQTNRVALEKMREQLRRDLSVGTGRVTRAQFINRQLHGYAGTSVLGETDAEKQARYQSAAATLGGLYDQILQEHKALSPTTLPKAAPPVSLTSPYSNKDDVVNAFKAGKINRAEAARILNEQFGVPLK